MSQSDKWQYSLRSGAKARQQLLKNISVKTDTAIHFCFYELPRELRIECYNLFFAATIMAFYQAISDFSAIRAEFTNWIQRDMLPLLSSTENNLHRLVPGADTALWDKYDGSIWRKSHSR